MLIISSTLALVASCYSSYISPLLIIAYRLLFLLSSFTGFLLDGETYQNLKDPWWRQSVRDWATALMEQNSMQRR
jgi:tryptophan-rich sensory protein